MALPWPLQETERRWNRLVLWRADALASGFHSLAAAYEVALERMALDLQWEQERLNRKARS